MCLALPAEIVDLHPETDEATVSLDGVRKRISVSLVEDPQVGEYVLIHVGFALGKISAEEAGKTLQLMAEAGLVPPQNNSDGGSRYEIC